MANIAAIERRRAYAGPALLKQGFRPFFLGASLWAALSLILWILALTGRDTLASAWTPIDWHIHELLFGYTMAVIAGFLLTAVPNWTGRLPISGLPLFILFFAWMAGRITVYSSAHLPVWLVATIDLTFPVMLAGAIARELIAGRNYKNLRVLALVVVIALANLLFHIAAASGDTGLAVRLGISAILMLIMLIGGRIIPSFTRNWLARQKSDRLPVPFGRFDIAVMALSAVALVIWITVPGGAWTGAALAVAGLINLMRLARWSGRQTLAEPLVTILHIGYLFLPLGFFAMAGTAFDAATFPFAAAMHLWTAGAIGTMTLAVMTRASLGHTGQALHADWRIVLIYGLALIAVITRVAAGYGLEYDVLLHLSATAWIGAYALFVIVYTPLMLR